jgi:hypothetical protein
MAIYNPSHSDLIQACLDTDLVIVTGRHLHVQHDSFTFNLCSELSNYKDVNLGIEILPTTFRNASKEEKRNFYEYVGHNYGWGNLYHLENMSDKVTVSGLQKPSYPKSNGLINDFNFCRGYYKSYGIISKDRLELIFIDEIKKQNLNVVLIGEKHQKAIYQSFPRTAVINQSCVRLNKFTPLITEIEDSFVVADSCKMSKFLQNLTIPGQSVI